MNDPIQELINYLRTADPSNWEYAYELTIDNSDPNPSQILVLQNYIECYLIASLQQEEVTQQIRDSISAMETCWQKLKEQHLQSL